MNILDLLVHHGIHVTSHYAIDLYKSLHVGAAIPKDGVALDKLGVRLPASDGEFGRSLV